MTEYVASELRRIIGKIPETDPATMEYHVLLQSLEIFANISESLEELMARVDEETLSEGESKVVLHPMLERALAEKANETEDFPPEDETPFPAGGEAETPAPEETVAVPVEEKTYEMTEVRAALVEARRKGVNVSALLREFGVENFGAFPAGKYGELMKRLEG